MEPTTIVFKKTPCGHFNDALPHLREEPSWQCDRQLKYGGVCKFAHVLNCDNPECIAFRDRRNKKNLLHHTMHARDDCPRAGSTHSPSTNPDVVLRETVAQGNSAPILSARGGFRPHNLMVGGGMGRENSEDLSSSDWRAKAAIREQEEGQIELAKFEERVYTEGSASFPKYGEMFSAIAGMFLEEEGRGIRDLEELLGESVHPITLIAFEICINVSPDRHEELLAKRQVLQEMVLNICEDEAATNPSPKNTDKG
jgi:hypothetical protein